MSELDKLLKRFDEYSSEGNSTEHIKIGIKETIREFCNNHSWDTILELEDELNDYLNM